MNITPLYEKNDFYNTARSMVEKLQKSGFKAFLVGGSVRDALLGIQPDEFDITTSARPADVRKLFQKTVPVGESFGVILVIENNYKFEIATFRNEWGYDDGRRPSEVVYSSDEREDVLRRDFTINGILYDPVAEKIYDYVNGIEDIRRGVIRTIGDPYERFREDKLRVVRGIRFAARFNYSIEETTLKAIRETSNKIRQVSFERIRDEIVSIITQNNPGNGIRLLNESCILVHILPEVARMDKVPQPPEFHPEGDVLVHTCIVLEKLYEITGGTYSDELAMGALLHDIGKPPTFEQKDRIRFNGHDRVGASMALKICKRLRFSKKQTDHIAALVREHLKFKDVFNMRESTLRRFMNIPRFEEHLTLHLADCLGSHGMTDAYEFVRNKLAEYEKTEIKPKPLITGRDLIGIGFEPGPEFSKILDAVEEQQLEGAIKDRQEALDYVVNNFNHLRVTDTYQR